jgi:chaperonin GroEL (HSP60 family)
VIISAYNKALKEALEIVQRISIPIDVTDDGAMLALIKTSIGTKFVVRRRRSTKKSWQTGPRRWGWVVQSAP